jgi:hypothetical protein
MLITKFFANKEYSILHCCLTKMEEKAKVNHTPKKRKEDRGDSGVMLNCFDGRKKENGCGAEGSGRSGISGSLLQISSALSK